MAKKQAPTKVSDYSLTGKASTLAVEKGLAEADWYQCPVPRAELRKLLERRDGPAIRDTILWFALLGLTGWGTVALWGTWWVMPTTSRQAESTWPDRRPAGGGGRIGSESA